LFSANLKPKIPVNSLKGLVSFVLPEGFSPLVLEDTHHEFRTESRAIDRYSLRDHYDWSLGRGRYVFVYKPGRKVLGLLRLELLKDHVLVDLIARNRLFVESERVGTKLMRLAEDIARQTNRPEVRLESVETAIGFYDDKLGYEEYDQSYKDDEYGTLTPKRKKIV